MKGMLDGKGEVWKKESSEADFDAEITLALAMEILFADTASAASYSLLALPPSLYHVQLEICPIAQLCDR